MAELRTLHVTDIHDDFEKYQVIAKYIAGKKESEQSVDAVFITGDFIEGHPDNKSGTANLVIVAIKHLFDSGAMKAEKEEFETLIKKYGKDGKVDPATLDDAVKKQFEDVNSRSQAKQSETVTKTITQAYQKHAEELNKLGISIFGIMGNHDLTLGYEILKDKVNFVENANKVTIKGKSGIEFIVKGDLNTMEVPVFYSKLPHLFENLFIPYESGYSLSELSKQVNAVQKKLSEAQQERLDKKAKNEEPQHTEEQLKEMGGILQYTAALRKEVLEYHQAELQRLGDKKEVDIYLTHRLPNCKKANPKIEGSVSDATAEYAANAKAVYGGHFHDGQIGYRTIEDFLKQEAAETTSIDGVEVNVFYLDEKEPWELNPGTNHFFVTEYDANKQVEQVVIHEFYYEETA